MEEKKEDGFWSKGTFAETLGPIEREDRMKTFHKKHNEDMNFDCKSCKIKISAHNKDWHDGMCDKCFNGQYFPEEEDSQSKFEKDHKLSHRIETDEGHEDKLYVDAFFLFLQKLNQKDIQCYRLDEGKIVETLNLSFEEIKDNLYLECEDKGRFYDEDNGSISQAFTDNDSFYAIVQKGVIFFSGKDDAVRFMQEALDELDIKYFLDETSSF